MFNRFDFRNSQLHEIKEGVETSCMIPIPEPSHVRLEVRCASDVMVNAVTEDGVILPLDSGKIVRWKGSTEGFSAVEIVAHTSFFSLCQRSSFFEFVDPTPMVVELVQTKEDVIRTMIDERLKEYMRQQQSEKTLSQDEWDEMALDLIRGDLEFDETPDSFGLGYEERLAEFTRGQPPAEQIEGEPPVPPLPSQAPGAPPKSPAEGSDSSAT